MTEISAGPLGILGGTFDPVHFAHLQLAADASQKLGLQQVLWIPSGNPPHREPPLATAEQRLAMVALAIKRHDHYVLDDGEVRSDQPSYMVNTLQRLRDEFDSRPLVLLLGVDAYLGLHTWHRWNRLFDLAHIAVATRPGYALNPQTMNPELGAETQRRKNSDPSSLRKAKAGAVINFAMTPMDISATAIRARLNSGETNEHLLPAPVLDYIAANHLYSIHANH